MDLSLEGRRLVGFSDRTYRWIYEKLFAWNTGGVMADRAILAAIIRHPDYNFVSPTPHGDHARPGMHGPYRRAHIVTDDFQPIQPNSLIDDLTSWAHRYGAPNAEVEAEIRTIEQETTSASACFKLRDLQPEFQDPLRYLGDFLEFILVHNQHHRANLIVASSD
jgi:hypothetical protein